MNTTIQTNDGRVFTLVREEPYVRKDGAAAALKVWSAPCAQCGTLFTVKTPAAITSAAQSKSFGAIHCDAHKLSAEQVKSRWADAVRRGKQNGK